MDWTYGDGRTATQSDTNDPNYNAEVAAFDNNEQAPHSPDGTYRAYVCNTNDFATQIVSNYNVNTSSPYNVPAAVLGCVTLPRHTTDNHQKFKSQRLLTAKIRAAITVITKINVGGQITVQHGPQNLRRPE